jgi:hypothetical protein
MDSPSRALFIPDDPELWKAVTLIKGVRSLISHGANTLPMETHPAFSWWMFRIHRPV